MGSIKRNLIMSDFLRKHIENIVRLSDEEYEEILGFFQFRKYRKRQFLIQENQKVDELFIVKSGLLKCGMIDNSGKEQILQFATEDWWISDYTAFYKHQPARLAVDCIEDSEVYSITFEHMNEVCRRIPKAEHFFRVKSNLGYCALQDRVLALMTKTAKERYEDFIHQYSEWGSRIPKQLIASYLGVSRETLSRLYSS